MKHLFLFTLLIGAVLVFWGCQEAISPDMEASSDLPMIETPGGDYPPSDVCVRTPGYWKNHPEVWVLDEGDKLLGRTQDEILVLLHTDNRHDKWLTLYRAVIAALLNKNNGADISCIDNEIKKGMTWLTKYSPYRPVRAGGKNSPWQTPTMSQYMVIPPGEIIYLKLDDYNNGKLCAPACD